MSEGDGSPPSRHRADMDLERLASGTFRTQTPNGAADLLSNEAELAFSANSAMSPLSPPGPFAIDGGGEDDTEDENELPPGAAGGAVNFGRKMSQESVQSTGTIRSSFVGHLLKGGTSMGSQADDGSVASGGSKTSRAGEGQAKISVLSDKTSKIMSDYQSYLAEIESEFEKEKDDKKEKKSELDSQKDDIRDRQANVDGELESHGAATPRDDVISGVPLQRTWQYSQGSDMPTYKDDILRRVSVDRSDDPYDFENLMIGRGQKYTHPLWHSRRVQKGLCGVLTAIIIVGMTVGITQSNKKAGLPDWEGQLSESEAGDDGGHSQITFGGMPNGYYPASDSEEGAEVRYNITRDKFKPLRYDRSNGWEGTTFEEAVTFCGGKTAYELCPTEAVCPNGPDNPPMFGTQDAFGFVPVITRLNEWVQVGPENTCIEYSHTHGETPSWGFGGGNDKWTASVMCCLGDKELNNVGYEMVSEKYKPKEFDRNKGWAGSSYAEASEHCQGIDGYALCNYDYLCPFGPTTDSVVGTKNVPNAWVAINDNFNDWVNIGQDNACVAYSHSHNGKPDWGVTGEGSESITPSTVCCLAQPGDGEESENDMYEIAEATFSPELYLRSDNWDGTTYAASEEFCADKGGNLCPYRAVCVLGPDSEPISGYRGDVDAWVPLSDGVNEWVQVSSKNACVKYSSTSDGGPEWGISGSEELTENLLCCYGFGVAPTESSTDIDSQVEVEAPTVPPQVSHYSDGELAEYVATENKYDPIWYDRWKGWTGKTYSEAAEFCSKLHGDFALCPQEAICPLGEDSEPLGGFRLGPKGSWVPISDASNSWIQVSSDGPYGTCILYDHANEGNPAWGLSGEDDEEVTRNVACCRQPSLAGNASQVPAPSESSSESSTVATGNDMTIGDAEIEVYKEALEKYRPRWYDRNSTPNWIGQTYLEAASFCESVEDGFELCQYSAICPIGVDYEPIYGYRKEPDAWAPVFDKPNKWIQVGASGQIGSCIAWDAVEPNPPEWSKTGVNNEHLTRSVACCLASEQVRVVEDPASEPPQTPQVEGEQDQVSETIVEPDNSSDLSAKEMSLIYQDVSEAYQPKFFDRQKGWSGKTYEAALEFCQDFNDYIPCPYDALCPLGLKTKPLGGYKEGEGENGSWAPISDGTNEWVQLAEGEACVPYSHKHMQPPTWSEIGEDGEALTRHLACCKDLSTTLEPTKKPTLMPTVHPTKEPVQTIAEPVESEEVYYETAAEAFEPLWYTRDKGWKGQTYLEAIQFCASKESRVPCPYLVYCPLGPGNTPLGGAMDGNIAWAPIIDRPNAWVQVGGEQTCSKYTDIFPNPPEWGLSGKHDEDITGQILCCVEEPLSPEDIGLAEGDATSVSTLTEEEKTVMGSFKPQWYGRDSGYKGGKHEDAEEFCSNTNGMQLCPLAAFCPNGPVKSSSETPLFLHQAAFEDEQWAPVATDGDLSGDSYVLVGKRNNNPTSTCHTMKFFNDGELPSYIVDGTKPELKEHVLCCKDPEYVSGLQETAVDQSVGLSGSLSQQLDNGPSDLESSIQKELNPIWFGVDDGWTGGSHDDATLFCKEKSQNVCPYAAYCPKGPGQPTIGGHDSDIGAEGVQWAPESLGHGVSALGVSYH